MLGIETAGDGIGGGKKLMVGSRLGERTRKDSGRGL
jgi:hypothetical protein